MRQLSLYPLVPRHDRAPMHNPLKLSLSWRVAPMPRRDEMRKFVRSQDHQRAGSLFMDACVVIIAQLVMSPMALLAGHKVSGVVSHCSLLDLLNCRSAAFSTL